MQFLKRLFQRYKNKINLINKYANEDSVFIYQMGKVGSTSLENSIKNGIHIHSFYEGNTTCKVRNEGLKKFGLIHYILQIEQSVFEFSLRRAFRKRKSTKIITLIRDPFDRNLSMFFHDLDAYLFSAHTNCLNTRTRPIPTRNQSQQLLKQVYEEEFDHNYVVDWFDMEFKRMTGIDIYKYPFNKSLGYSRFSCDETSILCIASESLSNLEDVISEFLGQTVNLSVENRGEDKWYSSVYTAFRENYRLPMSIEEKILQSKFYRHFFH